MKRLLALVPLLFCLDGFASQARFEDDCLQRLRPLIPRDVKVSKVDFSALGNYASYYVVSYRFTSDLENGQRSATCTYRRDGEWLRDDAAAFKLARELARGKPSSK